MSNLLDRAAAQAMGVVKTIQEVSSTEGEFSLLKTQAQSESSSHSPHEACEAVLDVV